MNHLLLFYVVYGLFSLLFFLQESLEYKNSNGANYQALFDELLSTITEVRVTPKPNGTLDRAFTMTEETILEKRRQFYVENSSSTELEEVEFQRTEINEI